MKILPLPEDLVARAKAANMELVRVTVSPQSDYEPSTEVQLVFKAFCDPTLDQTLESDISEWAQSEYECRQDVRLEIEYNLDGNNAKVWETKTAKSVVNFNKE